MVGGIVAMHQDEYNLSLNFRTALAKRVILHHCKGHQAYDKRCDLCIEYQSKGMCQAVFDARYEADLTKAFIKSIPKGR